MTICQKEISGTPEVAEIILAPNANPKIGSLRLCMGHLPSGLIGV